MMLIAMAVYDTHANNRTWMTKKTLISLGRTVDWDVHWLVVVDNASCFATQEVYEEMRNVLPFRLLRNEINLGTAAAINLAWKRRRGGEACVKMDNDVIIHQPDWADWLEEVFERDPEIGICGLKRKDIDEAPWKEGNYHSTLRMLPHTLGQRWLVVEEVKHVMGACQAYSSALLDRIGYLNQPSLYGFDDSLASVRARVANFKCVYLHGFELDHIDPGGDAYCAWKRAEAGRQFKAFDTLKTAYQLGIQDVYYDGGFGT